MSVHAGRHPFVPDHAGDDDLAEQLEALAWFAVTKGIQRGRPLAAHIEAIKAAAVRYAHAKIQADQDEQARDAVMAAIRPRQ